MVDDECRMRDDLESSNPEEVGKELISNFHEFFSSFHDLLDKNDCILRWLSGYEVDHPIKHDYPELAKYVDIMAQVFEEEKDG